MTCEACAGRVARALRQVAGVAGAVVNYGEALGKADLSGPVPDQALTDAVARAGYRATVLRAPAAPAPPAAAVPARALARRSPLVDGSGSSDLDVFVIGSGAAGVAAALQAATMNARVAIAEGGRLGGTCVNVGCIPSKFLIEAAAQVHGAQRGRAGIDGCSPSYEWADVLRQKNELVTGLRAAKYEDVLASYPAVVRVHGAARFVDGGTVRVGDRDYRPHKVIVATGTSPALPPIEGLAEARPLDSTSAMEVERLPESLIVLGGSAVGLELGQMFARFGVKVMVIELMPRLLPSEDEAITTALADHLRADGIEIHLDATTTRVERNARGVTVHVRVGRVESAFHAADVLVAAGRRPNVRDLGLREAGVELTAQGFVRVDATMRTSNANVFAAGDVTGGPGHVYVAAAAGRVAAENAITSGQRELDLSVVPSVTFTSPQVAAVGMSEHRARAEGHHVEVAILTMEHVPRAIVSQDTRGLVKIVAQRGTGRILGVHAIAANAGEIMGEATLAVRFGLTTRDLTSTLHPYLTWSESLRLAAQGFSSDVTKLSCCA